MNWLLRMAAGLLTAVVAGILSAVLASLCVDWYQMSSFEGTSGYFVAFMVLLGLLGGLLIGVITASSLRKGTGFLKALCVSLAIVLGLLLIIGLIARLLADVAPTVGGEAVTLAVEIRWPPGQSPADNAGPGEWSVLLGSVVNHTQRASEAGPLWREDAREENGQWIVPGAVSLFTSRGDRILDVLPDGVIESGWVLPLPAYPGEEFYEWSDWWPHAREGDPPLPEDVSGGFRYRFRLVPVSQPIRTQSFGPFEIDTIAASFSEVQYGNQPAAWSADAQFVVRYRGQPLAIDASGDTGAATTTSRFERMDAVAALAGPRSALLVQVGATYGSGECFVIWEEGNETRTRRVAVSGDGLRAPPLTNDTTEFERSLATRVPDGRFDTTTFATPGQYLFPGVVLDTRTLKVRSFLPDDQGLLIERIPPLGVAPDGMSFVRLEWGAESTDEYGLAVIRLDDGGRTRIPVDRAKTRLADMDMVTPRWLQHYYQWAPGASEADGQDGASGLVARQEVIPLPYRGRLSQEGSYREYRIAGATPALRAAVVEFLVAEFGARPLPFNEADFAREARIGESSVFVGYDDYDAHVGIWMNRDTDTSLVATIAERFDEALATGRYDPLFAGAGPDSSSIQE